MGTPFSAIGKGPEFKTFWVRTFLPNSSKNKPSLEHPCKDNYSAGEDPWSKSTTVLLMVPKGARMEKLNSPPEHRRGNLKCTPVAWKALHSE